MTDEPDPSDEPLDGAHGRARDAIAAPPAPLDEATRRRLVARALAEPAPMPVPAPAPRPPSRWPAALAAAAAIAVVALGGWALVSSGDGEGGGSSASQAASSATTTAASRATLGDVSDPHRLLAQVRAALRGQAVAPPTTSVSIPGSRCAARVKTPAGVTAQPLSTATYRGAAVVVFVARDGPETLIYVLDPRDCRLLTSQFFRG